MKGNIFPRKSEWLNLNAIPFFPTKRYPRSMWRSFAKFILAVIAFLLLGVGFLEPYRLGFFVIFGLVILSGLLRLIDAGAPQKKVEKTRRGRP